jgi:hypothetical protein
MESIDEHCKNFATSSWTQFKVGKEGEKIVSEKRD